jgi:hypothetical protein
MCAFLEPSSCSRTMSWLGPKVSEYVSQFGVCNGSVWVTKKAVGVVRYDRYTLGRCVSLGSLTVAAGVHPGLAWRGRAHLQSLGQSVWSPSLRMSSKTENWLARGRSVWRGCL